MKYLYTLLFVFLLIGCAANNTPPVKTKASASTAVADDLQKQIIGSVEPVRLLPPDTVVHARIDTGAVTSSIDAREIIPFERDGKPWVRFVFVSDGKRHLIEKPVEKRIRIKQHEEGSSEERYIVKMRLVLGKTSQVVSVSLADRSRFKYPVLIGRNFLRDVYIVDVAKQLTTTPESN